MIKKFALVFRTLTLTVLEASVRALVNNPHMIASKTRFMPKKDPRIGYSMYLLGSLKPRREEILAAQEEVREVVVLCVYCQSGLDWKVYLGL